MKSCGFFSVLKDLTSEVSGESDHCFSNFFRVAGAVVAVQQDLAEVFEGRRQGHHESVELFLVFAKVDHEEAAFKNKVTQNLMSTISKLRFTEGSVEHGSAAHFGHGHADTQEGVVLGRVMREQEADFLQFHEFSHGSVADAEIAQELESLGNDGLGRTPILQIGDATM